MTQEYKDVKALFNDAYPYMYAGLTQEQVFNFPVENIACCISGEWFTASKVAVPEMAAHLMIDPNPAPLL